MIGNDIVDLAQAKLDSHWRRKGFLDKIFTRQEQYLIHAASNPDSLVWLVWSMKESAYKISVRETGKRVFDPQKIVCHINPEDRTEGTVFYGKVYQTKSIITQNYIATMACQATSSQIPQQVIISLGNATYQNQHTAIRKKIKEHVASNLSIPEVSIYINSDQQNIPTLTYLNALEEPIILPISISHHGYYAAYSIGYDSDENCLSLSTK